MIYVKEIFDDKIRKIYLKPKYKTKTSKKIFTFSFFEISENIDMLL